MNLKLFPIVRIEEGTAHGYPPLNPQRESRIGPSGSFLIILLESGWGNVGL